jgi:mannose-6-phosphate isomerase
MSERDRQGLYPLRFEPILKERVWGGRRLATLGKALEGDQPVGESWELVDLPEDQSRVAEGPLLGARLRDLIERSGPAILGPVGLDGGSFPLLVKYIDAAQDLSVQVHPDAVAAARLGGRPKSEAWTVLDAAPGAKIFLGLRPGTRREDLEAALCAGQVPELLQAVPVSAGDIVPVPPGTTHAIGAGVLLAEVQQPSDTTYRVYDWGRVGLDGKPRALHRREALESIHFEAQSQRLRAPVEVDLDLFQLRALELQPGETVDLGGEGPLVAVGLEGRSVLAARGTSPVACQRGKVILVPHACRAGSLAAEDRARLLLVTFRPAP